jgi:NitT/TauT family transport system substrate-binding protein
MLAQVAADNGDFTREKLPTEIVPVSGSTTTLLPMVLNGQVNFGTGGLTDLLPAISKGVPIVVLPGFGSAIEPDLTTATNVIVTANPSITSLTDLVGKRVGLNALGNSTESFLRLELKKAGVDPGRVTFVQIPTSNMPDAVQKGQIDAGQALEPYLTIAKGQGERPVHAIGGAVAGGLPSAVFFTSKQFAQSHPGEIEAFTRAMASATAAAADPATMRALAKKYTKVPPDVLDKEQNFGLFTTDITPAKIDQEAALVAGAGLIPSKPDLSTYVYSSSR